MSVSTRADDSWTVCFDPRRALSVRLLCLPRAGAGASSFRGWGRELPDWLEVHAVQLPGREGRFREPLPHHVGALADDLAQALDQLTDAPYALFGHSMGALVAFELSRRLEAAGRAPLRLFVAGYGAPHVYRSTTRIPAMSHDEVVEELRRTPVTPDSVLADPGLMRIFVPIVQADLRMCVRHEYDDTDAVPLAVDVSAFGGMEDDDVAPDVVAAWADLTTGSFRLRMLPGGHFFPVTARVALLEAIAGDLRRRPGAP
jgi:medium-chain acyl-[acyl-carrier-protein] hydrolase